MPPNSSTRRKGGSRKRSPANLGSSSSSTSPRQQRSSLITQPLQTTQKTEVAPELPVPEFPLARSVQSLTGVGERTQSTISTHNYVIGDDYVSVQPRQDILRLSLGEEHQSIDGYIETSKDNFLHAMAIVDSDFEDNFISQLYAEGLGLEIQPLDPDDFQISRFVIFKSGQRVRKVGDTSFVWTNGRSSHETSFRVYCSVYEDNIKPLIFGQPFLDKRRHYWSKDQDTPGSRSQNGNYEPESTGSSSRQKPRSVDSIDGNSVAKPPESKDSHKLRRATRGLKKESRNE